MVVKADNFPQAEFWRGKRVLLTGHTGFKGAWLTIWLERLGAVVHGISLPPTTSPNLFESAGLAETSVSRFVDIRDAGALSRTIAESDPEIVLHLAAQALVRPGYSDPAATFATNTQGTVNVLDALRQVCSPRVVVAITTDKVYRNLEHGLPYRETDTLGGFDPYSASKAAAELVISAYRSSYFESRGIALAVGRAGNVIGGGDWAADRLIPDLIRASNAGAELEIRRPKAVRPWQHVLDPLAGYLKLAEVLWSDPSLADAYNFGPLTHEAASVRDVVELAATAYPVGKIDWGDGTEGPHEANLLTLEIAKARQTLGFTPLWSLEEAVLRTMRWFGGFQAGESARSCCLRDIDAYEEARSPE